MNGDLAAQLNEMGPAYRAVVERLLVASVPSSVRDDGAVAPRRGRFAVRKVGYLVAAGAVAVIGLSALFRPASEAAGRMCAVRVSSARLPYTLAYAGDAAAVDEIVRTQRADGGWTNDFLAEQNAAVLRAAVTTDGREQVSVAYRRAVRYLRSRGLRPLSADELQRRRDFAARALGA